jgi:transcriptional regulator with XRE-family HTH domain
VDIGGRLRTARRAAGLTQEGVARRSGLTLKHIGEVERGEVQDPHYSTLIAIAHALGTTVAELVGEESEASGAKLGKASAPPEPGHKVPMPGTSGHAHGVEIAEGDEPTRVEITKTSFFELMRNVKAGRLSEEDAWQRFQEEAG